LISNCVVRLQKDYLVYTVHAVSNQEHEPLLHFVAGNLYNSGRGLHISTFKDRIRNRPANTDQADDAHVERAQVPVFAVLSGVGFPGRSGQTNGCYPFFLPFFGMATLQCDSEECSRQSESFWDRRVHIEHNSAHKSTHFRRVSIDESKRENRPRGS
jgi:hypothetical protein